MNTPTIPQMDELVHTIEAIAEAHHAHHIEAITLELGACCNVTPTYFREHFLTAAEHTLAEDAELIFVTNADVSDKHAHDVTLLEIEIT